MRPKPLTVTIELTDSQAAALQEQAERRGMTLEAWMGEMVSAFVPPDTIAHLQKTDPEEWARRFDEWINAPRRNVPVLSDEAMSRESIYPDRV